MKLTKRIGKIHKTYVLIGGCGGIFGGIAVAATVGSPLPVLRLLGAGEILPPLWLMGLIWLAGYGLLGAAVGLVLGGSSGNPCRDAPAWRGLTFLTVEVTFSFAWYSLSFGSFLLLPAWICLVLGVAAGTACTASWFRVHRMSAIICIGVTLWFVYLVLCHLVVILHN